MINLAAKIADDVLEELQSRRDFGQIIETLDESTGHELRTALEAVVSARLKEVSSDSAD